MTIGERLRYLRKSKLGYKNCDDFGAQIGLSGSNITHTSHTKNRHIIGSYATLGI